MPHTSKKYRKQNAAGSSGKTNRTTLFIVIAVVAIIAVAGGFFVLSSAKSTTTTSSIQTTATSGGNVTSSSSATASSQSGLIYAKLDTSQGTFEIELFSSLTPKTVANFVSLANSGFYNNLVWHRIVPGFRYPDRGSNNQERERHSLLLGVRILQHHFSL